MRLFTALKKNIVPILFVVVVVGLLIYMTQRKEGFNSRRPINQNDCVNREKTVGGSYTWKNGVCWAPCGQGVKMRNYNTCGPLDDRFTADRKRYPRNSEEYRRFYKPQLFTRRPKAYY